MDDKAQATRSYEDFQPSTSWMTAEGQDTVVVSLPGFKKDHLRIQMGNQGYLKITGERPLEGNRWSRFQKDFQIPKNLDTNKVHAKLIGGLLYVIIPKKMFQPTLKDPAAPTLQSPATEVNESQTDRERNVPTRAPPDVVNEPTKEENGIVHGSPQPHPQSQSQSQTETETVTETGNETETETGTETETETETEMENHNSVNGKGVGSESGNPGRRMEANLETNETSSKRKQAGAFKFGLGGSVSRLNKRSRVVIVYGAVAIVVVFLGMYATYKLRSVEEIETFEN